jgi:hypothetical protein
MNINVLSKTSDVRMTTCCFYSSFIFITNCLFALSKGHFTYSLAFYTLTLTSVAVHGIYYGVETMILDKASIFIIVILGGQYFFSSGLYLKREKWFIILTFMVVGWIYYYGYLTNQFCYHPDKAVANVCNSFIHIVSSIGHHLIIYAIPGY